ncbi:probable protein phosphatase 2C 72 [Hibiscus syriacus]|uniref:probable protein phosphatase 2C 72 n=1 Tax=Hibiscus syriacus TaxID=106335 RepID=UPI0019244FCC|nr:probable protein phosphatase 2C 72 [Hibiscus syriacus]
MGICISVASSEIHEDDDCHLNNLLFLAENIASLGIQRLGSLYTKQGSKGLNQDAAILYQDYGMEGVAFCGVFDGHGKNGHVVSNMVRNRLPSLLLSQKNALEKIISADEKKCQAKVDKTDIKSIQSKGFLNWQEACISAFKLLDKEIMLQENLDCSTSGTTAVVVVRQSEDLVIANVGDSRAVLGTMTENGIKAVQLTTDLKPGLPSEAERIRYCKGRVLALKEEPHIQRVWLPHEDSPGLAMSRAFGDFLLKNHGIIAVPDVFHHHLTPNDQFIVLATDGVWDVLNNEQVATIVLEAENEQAASRAVVEAATASWKKNFPSSKVDDCTVVCLFLQKKQKPSSLCD